MTLSMDQVYGFMGPQVYPKQVAGLGFVSPSWVCPAKDREDLTVQISVLLTALSVAKTEAEFEAIRSKREELLECHVRMGQKQLYAAHGENLRRIGDKVNPPSKLPTPNARVGKSEWTILRIGAVGLAISGLAIFAFRKR